MRLERYAPLEPSSAAYLLDQVRSFEPDWLLPLPYVDLEQRGAWLTLLAFGAEVLGAPRRVSNGMLGQIRLQWWREALDEVFQNVAVRQHPVVENLAFFLRERPAFEPVLKQVIAGMEPFLAPGEDESINLAMGNRSSYGHLGHALSMLTNGPQVGTGLMLHSLCRVAPSGDLVPSEDGTELPSARFARFLATSADGEAQLAEALETYRREGSKEFSLAGLPLSLFVVRKGRVERLNNPLCQKTALFFSVLRGRI